MQRLETLWGPGNALLRASGCRQDPGTNDAGPSPHPMGPQGLEHGSPAGGLLPQHVFVPGDWPPASIVYSTVALLGVCGEEGVGPPPWTLAQ